MGDNSQISPGRVVLLVFAWAALGAGVAMLLTGQQRSEAFVVAALFSWLVFPLAAASSFEANPARTSMDIVLLVSILGTSALPIGVLVSVVVADRAAGLMLVPVGFMLLGDLFVLLSWVRPRTSKYSPSAASAWSNSVLVCVAGGLISALWGPTLLGSDGPEPRSSRARSDAANIGKAIARMRTDTSNTSAACLTDITANLPAVHGPKACRTDGAELPECSDAKPVHPCWGGPYIPAVTNDPWHRPYTVTLDASSNLVEVFSRGRDGVPSADDITFIQ